MNKSAERYANIFNAVIFDADRSIESVSPLKNISVAVGHFKGKDVPVKTAVIEDDGIVNISIQFKDGHIGYEINVFSWASDDEFVRNAAETAHSRIMAWNRWEPIPA